MSDLAFEAVSKQSVVIFFLMFVLHWEDQYEIVALWYEPNAKTLGVAVESRVLLPLGHATECKRD